MSYLLMLFFGAWLLLSVAVHLNAGLARQVRRWDRWSLLPVWRFFVANAARHEFSIVRSAPAPDPEPAERLLPPPHSRAPWRLLFNPGRLDSKAFSDAAYFAVQAKDERVRRILTHILASRCDPPEAGTLRWLVLSKDNLQRRVTVADTFP